MVFHCAVNLIFVFFACTLIAKLSSTLSLSIGTDVSTSGKQRLETKKSDRRLLRLHVS